MATVFEFDALPDTECALSSSPQEDAYCVILTVLLISLRNLKFSSWLTSLKLPQSPFYDCQLIIVVGI